jgi:hypothetical protein
VIAERRRETGLEPLTHPRRVLREPFTLHDLDFFAAPRSGPDGLSWLRVHPAVRGPDRNP